MTEFLTLNVAFALIAILIVCCVYALIYITKVNARLNKSINLINDLYQLSQEQTAQLADLSGEQAQKNNDQDATQTQNNHISEQAILDMQTRVEDIDRHLKQVAHQTELLQQTDPETKMYTKANQLAESGASIDDIVEACGLPRAEVDVLMGLQRKKQ
jgi:predicted nucleic acid-binding protein